MFGNCEMQNFYIILANCVPYFVKTNSYLGHYAKVRMVDQKAIFHKSFDLLSKIVQCTLAVHYLNFSS